MTEDRFDVTQWLKMGEAARTELQRREHEIIKEIKASEEELEAVRKSIARVNDVLGSSNEKKRPNILGSVKDITAEFIVPGSPDWWPEKTIVDRVFSADPSFNASSVTGALRRLVEKNVLVKQGRRGHWEYRSAAEVFVDSDDGRVPEKSPYDNIKELIMKSGRTGVHTNDVLWVVGDVELVKKAIEKMIAEGIVELYQVDSLNAHYRAVVHDGPPKANGAAKPADKVEMKIKDIFGPPVQDVFGSQETPF